MRIFSRIGDKEKKNSGVGPFSQFDGVIGRFQTGIGKVIQGHKDIVHNGLHDESAYQKICRKNYAMISTTLS
jgi:hypothetical protein